MTKNVRPYGVLLAGIGLGGTFLFWDYAVKQAELGAVVHIPAEGFMIFPILVTFGVTMIVLGTKINWFLGAAGKRDIDWKYAAFLLFMITPPLLAYAALKIRLSEIK